MCKLPEGENEEDAKDKSGYQPYIIHCSLKGGGAGLDHRR